MQTGTKTDVIDLFDNLGVWGLFKGRILLFPDALAATFDFIRAARLYLAVN